MKKQKCIWCGMDQQEETDSKWWICMYCGNPVEKGMERMVE